MKYMSVGAVVGGKTRVIVESWTLGAGDVWIALEEYEFHFEFRGVEEAIANYISTQESEVVSAMRFSLSDETVIGTWTRAGGYREHG
ncbi:hypothetical protein SEA_BIG4_307 [Microbacterium phage Big4]|nr:hypothetical protein SEA_BIG4_307 [Microbacterium phage Big4]